MSVECDGRPAGINTASTGTHPLAKPQNPCGFAKGSGTGFGRGRATGGIGPKCTRFPQMRRLRVSKVYNRRQGSEQSEVIFPELRTPHTSAGNGGGVWQAHTV